MTVATAIESLNRAVSRLEGSFEAAQTDRAAKPSVAEEVQRLNLDRAELARKLDQSEERFRSAADANREVSRRLIAAMEAIRSVAGRS